MIPTPGFSSHPDVTGRIDAFLGADDEGYTLRLYYIYVEDNDNVGGSGLDTCYIDVNGVTRTRTCNNYVSITVGRGKTGADCAIPERDRCIVKVWAKDNAENENTLEVEVGHRLRNRTLNAEDFFKHDFSVWYFGVDWQSPIIPLP